MPAAKAPPTATKRFAKKTPDSDSTKSATELIDERIADLQDWRGELLSQIREVVRAADAGVTEEWKWNTPVWSCHGIICTGETYKKAVKLTFAKGASLPDPTKLFNSSLDGNVRRAIDFAEAALLDSNALKALIQAAISLNKSSPGSRRKSAA